MTGPKERWLCPGTGGIVAASVASVFGLLRLAAAGTPGADALTPLAFLVILFTVAVCGLTVAPVARRLGVAEGEGRAG